MTFLARLIRCLYGEPASNLMEAVDALNLFLTDEQPMTTSLSEPHLTYENPHAEEIRTSTARPEEEAGPETQRSRGV